MILQGNSVPHLTTVADVKSSASINLMNTTLQLQPASTCGWTNSGSTILSQINASVCPLAYRESLCLEILENYYLQVQMNPGSYNEDLPFEQIFVEDKVANVQLAIDNLIWQGQTGVAGNNGLCTGFITLANTTYSGTVVNGNVNSVTAITSSNIVGIVDAAVNAIPSGILNQSDLICYVGHDFFRTYSVALRNANLYHYPSTQDGQLDYQLTIPGTPVRMIAVAGLLGTNKFFISSKKNMYFFTDLTGDFEQMQMWFSQDFQELRTNMRWKSGVNAAYWDLVVYFKL